MWEIAPFLQPLFMNNLEWSYLCIDLVLYEVQSVGEIRYLQFIQDGGREGV